MVLDNILENLEPVDLASLCRTCRSLHGGALKYLYRDLTFRHWGEGPFSKKRHDLVETNIRRHTTLIPLIRSFTSYDPSFLQWMYTQATPPSLQSLELKWEPNERGTDTDSKFLELIPHPSREDFRELTFPFGSAGEGSILSFLYAFRCLRSLNLRVSHNNSSPSHSLQAILEQLHAPSLENLQVNGIGDWRVQWRPSFEETLRNLRSLRLDIDEEDDVMYDDGETPPRDEVVPPPGNVKWDTFVTLYQRSILFWITYTGSYISQPYLETALPYAKIHGLDPIPFIQWHINSMRMLYGSDLTISLVPLDDLTTILRATKSIDFRKLSLSLFFPSGTTPSIAHLLPNSVTALAIHLPHDCLLDPSVIPSCILSLPKLDSLHIFLNLSRDDFQPTSRFTAATCCFPSYPAGKFVAASFSIPSRWQRGWDAIFDGNIGAHVKKVDPGNEVLDFETEIREWFQLSTSLQNFRIFFSPG